MKVIFLAIVCLHALIHLLGFIKAFNIREIKELTKPVSRLVGVFWLLAAIILLVFVVMYWKSAALAWLAGFIGALLSQVLVIGYWRDTKFGTLLNIPVMCVSWVLLGGYSMKSSFIQQSKAGFAKSTVNPDDKLTPADITHLPLIVQRYLYYTKSVGKPKVKNFRAEFSGGMRGNPADEYMKFSSVQYNFYEEPSRFFYMEAEKMGIPATGLHMYKNATATFQVKLLNWITMVDASGEKLNQAETVTLFNDMCCIAPAMLIDNKIKWQTVNDTIVVGVFTNKKITIRGTLYFSREGRLINFISNDRYDTDGNQYKNYPWATPLDEYRLQEGYLLPGKARLVYMKPEGDFTYGELAYKQVQYNLMKMED